MAIANDGSVLVSLINQYEDSSRIENVRLVCKPSRGPASVDTPLSLTYDHRDAKKNLMLQPSAKGIQSLGIYEKSAYSQGAYSEVMTYKTFVPNQDGFKVDLQGVNSNFSMTLPSQKGRKAATAEEIAVAIKDCCNNRRCQDRFR